MLVVVVTAVVGLGGGLVVLLTSGRGLNGWGAHVNCGGSSICAHGAEYFGGVVVAVVTAILMTVVAVSRWFW